MKNKIIIISLIVFAILQFACSKNGSSGVLDIFIPNLSNQWVSSRGTFFFFTADKRDTNESSFTGSEQNRDTGDIFDLIGKYKDYDIEFTFINGDEKQVKYTGKFIKGSNPLRIEVTGTNNQRLTITQQL